MSGEKLPKKFARMSGIFKNFRELPQKLSKKGEQSEKGSDDQIWMKADLWWNKNKVRGYKIGYQISKLSLDPRNCIIGLCLHTIPGGPKIGNAYFCNPDAKKQWQQVIEHCSRKRMTPRLSNLVKYFSFQRHFGGPL